MNVRGKSESMRSEMMLKPATKFDTRCMAFGGILLASMCAFGSHIAARQYAFQDSDETGCDGYDCY